MQSTNIASKYHVIFLLSLLCLMCAIGCGGGAGATRSSGGSPSPGASPTPTPSPTPVTPSSASLTATPSSLNFGSQALNTPVTQTVKITNNGSAAAKITQDSISGTGFTVAFTTPVTINAAQSVNVSVVFTPSASGSVTGSFSLSSSGATLLSVPLAGTGFTPAAHSVDLAWTASNSTALQGYNVYRSGTTGGPYTKISSTLSSATLLFTDTSPQSGQKYFYVVTAIDVNGLESTASAEVAVTIPTP